MSDSTDEDVVKLLNTGKPQSEYALAGPSRIFPDEQTDFSYVCRICAVKTHNILPLFEKECLEQNLVEKINKYLPIKVSKDDLLPSGVCEQCSNAVHAWHELVVCCLQADTSFRKRISLSQSQPTLTSDIELDKNGIQFTKKYLVQVLPAPPYTDRLEVNVSSSNERCNVCSKSVFIHQNLTQTELPCCECRLNFTEKNIEVSKADHISWTLQSKPNVSILENNTGCYTPNNSNENETFKLIHPTGYCEANQPLEVNSSPTNNFIESNIRLQSHTTMSTDAEAISKVNIEQNEFSDHSDLDSVTYISESVFEAIEDTQDSVIVNLDAEKPIVKGGTKKSKHTKIRSCHICGKVYKASSSYFYHMKHTHGGSKDHSCDVCKKKFGTRGDLMQHSAVHTKECKFKCRSCDKKFRSRASRYIHEQIHEGIKNYKCPRCEKSFRWRPHLARHMLRHAAEKAHECSVCGRGFSVRCDLLRHVRTHEVGNYQCEKCDVKFAQMRYLRAHMTKKHNVTTHETS